MKDKWEPLAQLWSFDVLHVPVYHIPLFHSLVNSWRNRTKPDTLVRHIALNNSVVLHLDNRRHPQTPRHWVWPLLAAASASSVESSLVWSQKTGPEKQNYKYHRLQAVLYRMMYIFKKKLKNLCTFKVWYHSFSFKTYKYIFHVLQYMYQNPENTFWV